MNILRRATGREAKSADPLPAREKPAAPVSPPMTKVLLRPAPGCSPTPPPALTPKQEKEVEDLRAYGQELHEKGWHPTPGPGEPPSPAPTHELHPDPEALVDAAYKPHEAAWLADPGTCLRFYRAAKHNLEHARKRLHATLIWRRSYQPEIIPPDEVFPEAETGKSIVTGFDREARPILYLRPGRENTPTSDRQIRFLVWNLERLIDLMPEGQEKACIIIDYKSATQQSNPSWSTSMKVLHILQEHYCERLGRACISNVPWFINMFYTAIRPLLDPVVKSKIQFNIPMTDAVPADQLDSEWTGGTYHFDFDAPTYWSQLIDFCGIAPDGTRTHPSFARSPPDTKSPAATAPAPAPVPAPAPAPPAPAPAPAAAAAAPASGTAKSASDSATTAVAEPAASESTSVLAQEPQAATSA